MHSYKCICTHYLEGRNANEINAAHGFLTKCRGMMLVYWVRLNWIVLIINVVLYRSVHARKDSTASQQSLLAANIFYFIFPLIHNELTYKSARRFHS